MVQYTTFIKLQIYLTNVSMESSLQNFVIFNIIGAVGKFKNKNVRKKLKSIIEKNLIE